MTEFQHKERVKHINKTLDEVLDKLELICLLANYSRTINDIVNIKESIHTLRKSNPYDFTEIQT